MGAVCSRVFDSFRRTCRTVLNKCAVSAFRLCLPSTIAHKLEFPCKMSRERERTELSIEVFGSQAVAQRGTRKIRHEPLCHARLFSDSRERARTRETSAVLHALTS